MSGIGCTRHSEIEADGSNVPSQGIRYDVRQAGFARPQGGARAEVQWLAGVFDMAEFCCNERKLTLIPSPHPPLRAPQAQASGYASSRGPKT
jgi:hypothetical protein